MEKYKLSFKQSFLRSSINAIECLTAFVLIFVISFLLACAGEKMSLEEAKNVTVTMKTESFVPPPRRIDDILSVLEQPGNFDSEVVKRIEAEANAEPPLTSNPAILANFYDKRGKSAINLGRYRQELEDLRKALRYAEKEPGKKRLNFSLSDYARLLNGLAIAEARYGNFMLGIYYLEKSFKIQPTSVKYYLRAWLYIEAGDFQTAEKIIKQGIGFCNTIIQRRGAARSTWAVIDRARLKATLLEASGQFAAAEPYRRAVVDNMRIHTRSDYPFVYIYHRVRLAKNLASQGLFIDAELEVRKALEEIIGLAGKDAGTTGEIIEYLGYILLLQGRVEEAEKILRTGIRLLQAAGLSSNSTILINSILKLCSVYVAERNFAGAVHQYDQVKQSVQENQFYYQKNVERSPDVMFALIKTGRLNEALPFISNSLNDYSTFLGTDHPLTAEILALRAITYFAEGKKQNALNDFSTAMPILMAQRTETETNYPKKMRLRFIIEEYLKFLGDIYKTNLERQFKIDVSAESFKLVQVLIESAADKALGATSARAASVSLDLADLVRKEQDSLKQILALQATLLNAVSASSDQQNPEAVKELKDRIRTIRMARAALLDEIRRRFPKYSDFTDPQPQSLTTIQKHLRSGEAMLTVVPTPEHTSVWAIPSSGPIAFHILNLGENAIKKMVVNLRKALDPKPKTYGDIPDFNLELAYDLYRQLFEPVEAGWNGATDLIVIASGPLGPLPFSVLPTRGVTLENENAELFSNYRKIPWLIRKVSITRQPSISSFVTLRNLPKPDPHLKAFAGFGDPLFNKTQLAATTMPEGNKKADLSIRLNELRIRGIRISAKGNLDSKNIVSIQLEDLKRLPETAEEIKSIAAILSADPDQDIFLGIRASEHRIKTMDLSDRRIIVFASHALIPGDLDGLNQPAIALCSPTVTEEHEDGLLTMGEVLKLNLNADWVVLSSCNSGASDGRGAEALSGLGQAFFYAGTKALLASMWPVESTSARKLTTGLFRYQQEDPTLSRARALQKSSLALIDGPGLKDPASGRIVASYAHPLFWAPFIIVGESGSNAN